MSTWLWAAVALATVVILWLLLVGALLAFGRKEDARELLAFIPDCVILVKRLLGDRRVPRRAKVILVALLAYLVMPVDVVPDFIPIAGQLDDAILVAAVLAYVVRRAGRHVIGDLWPGSQRGLRAVLALARA